MPVRKFTMSRPMDEALASAEAQPTGMTKPARSDEAAKASTNTFSDEAKNPLANDTNPASKPGITFAAQEKLPKLPIPELEASCKKYIIALEPLQNSREHSETKAAVEDFVQHEGPELQERLKRYATGKSSYIEQFCEQNWDKLVRHLLIQLGYDSYLNFDNPVVLNLNPFFLLEDDPTPARNNQVTRAASLVVSSLAFVRAVRKEELPPDMLRGQPLDMYQYSRLFGTARIPTENGCQIGQDPTSKHVVILARGQFYWFDVLDRNNDLIMTEKDIALNLQVIVDDAQETPIQEFAKSAVGVLSTENRKIWSSMRDVLSREEGSNNSDSLNIVDSALFILCLDYSEPKDTADLCMNMLCGTSKIENGLQIGTCTNRWYDKLQIIVCKNGSAGINFEHTGVDGHTVLRFASDVYTDTILRFARSINGQAPSLWASSSPDPAKRDPASFGDVSTTPHKLEWDMVPEVSTAIRFAETRLADLIQQNEFATLEFSHYGKNFLTSRGFSPDAFVQMAFQAAYYGLYGRMECVYEPAMTKIYYHGRTEAIRSVTPESTEFVRLFWGENPPLQKVEALKKACAKHTAITRECAKAQGQDRHLYALFCVWQKMIDGDEEIVPVNGDGSRSRGGSMTSANGSSVNGSASPSDMVSEDGDSSRSPLGRIQTNTGVMPSIFSDGGWDKLNSTILSTSNCGNPSLRQFGFGPTSGDGFGIGYIIKDGSISICASSKHRQTQRYIDALEGYFLELRRILKQTQRRGTNSDKLASRAREVEVNETKRPKAISLKSRGRLIDGAGTKTPLADSEAPSDDEDLGGCEYYHAVVYHTCSMWHGNTC